MARKEKETEYAKAYYDKSMKASGEKLKLTPEYKRTRAKKREESQAVYGAKKTIDRGRNILKSSTNDPGEKVMGVGKKRPTTAKRAAKITKKAPTTYAPKKKLTQKKK